MTGIKPRTARVVIYQGDDLAHLAELDQAATKAEVALRAAERRAKNTESRPALTLDEEDDSAGAVIDARERYDEAVADRDQFAEEAEQRGVVVVLQQLGRKEWRRLRNAHPPRDGNSEDEVIDCNVDSMPDEAIPLSVVASESTIEGDVGAFLDSLSSHDYYNRLFMTVLALNVGGASADPKLRVGSATSRISSAT